MDDSRYDEFRHNLCIERRKYEGWFCGCAFISPDIALQKCSWLDEGMFSDEKYKKFWGGLKEHGDALKASIDADATSDLSLYSTQIPSSLYPEEYARAILKFDYLIRANDSTKKLIMGVAQHDDCAVRSAIEYISEVRLASLEQQVARTPSEVSAEFIELITSSSLSVLTGIEELDKQMGGLFMGELCIMAARPGVGKTSLAVAIAQNVASDKNTNNRVLIFSLEMSRMQLWARLACAEAGISWKTIRSGRAAPEYVDTVARKSDELQKKLEGRVFIEDETWDVPGMINIAAKIRPDLCVIDHLGEIRWHEDEKEEVKWFGRATKMIRAEIARRLNCHVILVHQLNRQVETRTEKRPVLSDLRWSGELEQLADIVLMLYREDYYDDEANKLVSSIVPLEIWTRKNRQGVMNACATVNFNTEQQRFYHADLPNLKVIEKNKDKWYDR